eukprot:GFKZ01010617.1.p1 GENE.GFKZ01010617.1~~GFKZ01010617.1.p1  ORF type:complete len:799 (+),score=111.98 GFKZ01010617.1:46-2442(+)
MQPSTPATFLPPPFPFTSRQQNTPSHPSTLPYQVIPPLVCALGESRPLAPFLALFSTLFPTPAPPVSIPLPEADDDGLTARLRLRDSSDDDDGLSARIQSRPRKRARAFPFFRPSHPRHPPIAYGIPEDRVYEFVREAVHRRAGLRSRARHELATLLPYDLQRALFDELLAAQRKKDSQAEEQREEDGQDEKKDNIAIWSLPARMVGDMVKLFVPGKEEGSKVKDDAAVYAAMVHEIGGIEDETTGASAFAAAIAIASSASAASLEPEEVAGLKKTVAAARSIANVEDASRFVESVGVSALVMAARLLPGGERSTALTALANIAIMVPKSRVGMLKVGGVLDMLKEIVVRRGRFKVHQAVAGESALWQTEALVSGTHLLGSLALAKGRLGKEGRQMMARDIELVKGLQRLAEGLKNGEPEGAARAARRALGAMGVNRWKPRMPGQRGLRILSIDGGGTRAIMAFEALKELKRSTGCEIHELFDIIGGTSTGAIVAASIGIVHKTVEEVELLYRDMIGKIFARHPVNGPKMLLTRAYYDTRVLETTLQQECGKGVFIDSLAEENMNRVFVVSSIMSRNPKELHVFRNYTYPLGHESRYDGTAEAQLWEGLRASSAAPTFFTEIRVNGELHADGAIVANNPTAVALHETKCMYPGVPIELLVSLGNGVSPAAAESGEEDIEEKNMNMGWGDVVGSIVASATSTEVVHHAMQDLFPKDKYFRFNPVTDSTQIDETDADTLASFVREAQDYIRANREDFDLVARILRPKTPRSMWRRFRDALSKEMQELKKSAWDDDLYLPN